MDDKTITSFKDLVPWQMGMELAERVHGATAAFPLEGEEIASRMRDASITIPAALSEAFAMESTSHLVGVIGPIAELETCVELAKRLGFLAEDLAEDLGGRVEAIAQSIGVVLDEVDHDLEDDEDYPGKPRQEEGPRDQRHRGDCGCGGHGRGRGHGHGHGHGQEYGHDHGHGHDYGRGHGQGHGHQASCCCEPPRRRRRYSRDDDCCC